MLKVQTDRSKILIKLNLNNLKGKFPRKFIVEEKRMLKIQISKIQIKQNKSNFSKLRVKRIKKVNQVFSKVKPLNQMT